MGGELEPLPRALRPQKLATGEMTDWSVQSTRAEQLGTQRALDHLQKEIEVRVTGAPQGVFF